MELDEQKEELLDNLAKEIVAKNEIRSISDLGKLIIGKMGEAVGVVMLEQMAENNGYSNTGMEEKILALHVAGKGRRDIAWLMKESWNLKVTKEVFDNIFKTLPERVSKWRQRDLKEFYPFVYVDSFIVAFKGDNGNKFYNFFYAFGYDAEGEGEVLGFWLIDLNEIHPVKQILKELMNRGVKDISYLVMNILSEDREEIECLFPKVIVQNSIAVLFRRTIDFILGSDKKKVYSQVKKVYCAKNFSDALDEFEKIREAWPQHSGMWKCWEEYLPHLRQMFMEGDAVRKVLCNVDVLLELHEGFETVTKKKYYRDKENFFQEQYLEMLGMHANNISWKGNWKKVKKELGIVEEKRTRRR